ncbi:MAG: leucyl aminopeptidase [Candidatus Nanoarchaeia archaeon]
MKCSVKTDSITSIDVPVIVGVFEEQIPKALDTKLKGKLTELLKREVFKGEKGQIYTLDSDMTYILVGLGKEEESTLDKLRLASSSGCRKARSMGVERVTTNLSSLHVPKTNASDRAEAVVEGAIIGLYRFTKCKTEELDKLKHLYELVLLVKDKDVNDTKLGAKRGNIIGTHANIVKDMANAPANIMNPLDMANMARRLAKEAKLKCTVFDKKKIQKVGLNAVLAVNSGSDIEPRFVILEYSPRKAKKTILLVGKGITFDSGGLQLKPTKGMGEMRYDMTGAAIMMNTIAAAAKLNVKNRIIAVTPCTENLTGGSAYKPADVIKMYNGKTVVVNNTDAEGRLVLADGLAYGIKNFKPDLVIDAATLTGAAIVSLGNVAAPLMGNDEDLIETIKEAGTYTNERVWELPLWDDYKELMKSKLADLSNIGLGPRGYEAGSITAGAFLSNFVDETPWAHLDVAGTVWCFAESGYYQKGSTGFGVRLLVNTLERL